MNSTLLSNTYQVSSSTHHEVSDLIYRINQTPNLAEREMLLDNMNKRLDALHKHLDAHFYLAPYVDFSNSIPRKVTIEQATLPDALDMFLDVFEAFRFKLVKQQAKYNQKDNCFFLSLYQTPLTLVKNNDTDEYSFHPEPLPAGPKSYLTKLDAWVSFFTFLSIHTGKDNLRIEPEAKKEGLSLIKEHMPFISVDKEGKIISSFLGFPEGTPLNNISTTLKFQALL